MTAGEIVPVVATMSGRYDRAEDIFGLVLALVLLTIYWLFFPASATTTGWSSETVSQPSLWPVLAIIVVGFIVGAFLATIFPVLGLPFIARREMQEEVERRATETFQRLRIRATSGSTGVLIYVSLFEHMVHVVGDDAVNEKITTQDWQSVADLIVAGMKQKRSENGLAVAILKCGDLLRKHFPLTESAENQLSDGLVFLD
jgi:putative membrane protein